MAQCAEYSLARLGRGADAEHCLWLAIKRRDIFWIGAFDKVVAIKDIV